MKIRLLLKKYCPLLGIAFLVLLLLPYASLAQNPRGTLRGTVQDTSGGRISSAKIVVQAKESTLQREAASNDHGEFRIDDLLPGN
ncbi:MAG: carboxypeptidase-like regulatory domain-containing protein [Candidatus Acidiferrum sp.]